MQPSLADLMSRAGYKMLHLHDPTCHFVVLTNQSFIYFPLFHDQEQFKNDYND